MLLIANGTTRTFVVPNPSLETILSGRHGNIFLKYVMLLRALKKNQALVKHAIIKYL